MLDPWNGVFLCTSSYNRIPRHHISTFSVCGDRSMISGGRYSVVPHILCLFTLPYKVVSKRSTKPKITEFDSSVVHHQDIFRLDVPVQ